MTSRPSGILRGLFVLLLVALPASFFRGECRAEPARSAGLFADLDAIDISLEIRGPLDLQGSDEPELFAGELRRFNRFKSTLERSVGAKLESCGILWDEGGVDEVSIDVFGRREDLQEGPPHYVYLVQAEILNTTLAGRGAKAEPVPLRPVIGLADDAGIEQALIDTAVAIVAGELRSCDDQDGG